MFRQRNFYPSQNKQQQRQKPKDFSPKFPAKRHQALPIIKKLIPGHSAHDPHRRRFQQIGKVQYLSRQKPRIILNQQQVRNSATYKLLQQQILKLATRQQAQLTKLKELKKQKQQQISQIKKQQQGIKYQIWELKNQALDLKQSIKQEQEQNQRLQQELQGLNPSQNVSGQNINNDQND